MVVVLNILGILSVFLFLFLIYSWRTYNSFIKKRNQVKTDFSDVDIQVRRKASLIE